MGDEDQGQPRPSLEPPKLFGGRKRAKPTPARPKPAVDAASEPDDATTIFEVENDEFVEMIPQPTFEVDVEAPGALAAAATGERTPTTQGRTKTAAAPADKAAPKTARPPKPARTPRPLRPPRAVRAPVITGRLGAAVAGLLVGLLMIGLVSLGLKACGQVQGTSSCGTGPGMLLLLAMLVISVVVGRVLLQLFHVPDPGSTSFLAVGLVGVISLLFLIDVLDTWPMVIVIPAISALCFLGSWWVTTTFVEPADRN